MEKYQEIKERREKLGLSIDEVATSIKTTIDYYKKIEAGRCNLSPQLAERLSSLLETDIQAYKVDYKPVPRVKKETKLAKKEVHEYDESDEPKYRVLNRELKRVNYIFMTELTRLYKILNDIGALADKIDDYTPGLFNKNEDSKE